MLICWKVRFWCSLAQVGIVLLELNNKSISTFNLSFLLIDIREFKKLLRRRQRERHKTIGFNAKNKGPARAL